MPTCKQKIVTQAEAGGGRHTSLHVLLIKGALLLNSTQKAWRYSRINACLVIYKKKSQKGRVTGHIQLCRFVRERRIDAVYWPKRKSLNSKQNRY